MINDTAPWVVALLTARRRTMTAAAKLALVDDQNLTGQRLALAGVQAQHPTTPGTWQRTLIERRLGVPLVERLIDSLPATSEVIMDPSALTTMLDFTRACEALQLPYVVGGSLASSIYGEERSTRDVDVLIQLAPAQITPLFQALEPVFYLQRDDIAEAVRLAPTYRDTPAQRATFNAVHRSTFVKIDAFVASGRPFEQAQIDRRIAHSVAEDGSTVFATSPEDIILAKLEWFDLSNRVLDRQWSDVRAILAVQQSLDLDYLRAWARQLGVAALLDHALAGTSPYDPPNATQQRMF